MGRRGEAVLKVEAGAGNGRAILRIRYAEQVGFSLRALR